MKPTIGKYRLIAEIGRGGMATVYLAAATGPEGFNKLVVIKQPRIDLDTDGADVRAMFMNEARIAARLNHPNVVQTYEVGLDDDRPYIAMEYLEGQPLNRVRKHLKKHPRRDAIILYAIAQTLEALHHAHELEDYDGNPLRLVHRDATPQNIFVTYDGHIKLMDFGIAKVQGSNATQTGMLKGKLRFMAPEQIAGKQLDRRADIYSVGVVMWETLARRPLFMHKNDAAILHDAAAGILPNLLDVSPTAPAKLVDIAETALAFNRTERYRSAASMQHALEHYLDTLNPRVTRREVSAAMTEAFAQQRTDVAVLIKQHLGDVHASGDALPRIDAPSRPSMMEGTPSTQFRVATTQAPEAPNSKRSLVTAIGAVLAAAVVSGLLTAKLGSDATDVVEPDPGAAANTTPAAAAAEVAEAAAAEVRLVVSTSPTTATIVLDGVRVGAGSYVGELVKGRTIHQLLVEAEGYESRLLMVEADEDATLEVKLTQLGKRARQPGRSRPPTAAPPPAVESSPKAPQLTPTVDKVNPYK